MLFRQVKIDLDCQWLHCSKPRALEEGLCHREIHFNVRLASCAAVFLASVSHQTLAQSPASNPKIEISLNLETFNQQVTGERSQAAIDFEADQLTYSQDTDIVTAEGRVTMIRDGYKLIADSVVYNRKTGFVEARGSVQITDPNGNRIVGDKIELTDTLKDGLVENILLILSDGSRLGARNGNRQSDSAELERAVYSPCNLCTGDSTEERPLWRLKAVRVTYDQKARRIIYRDATFEFLNIPILYVPYISHPDPRVNKASGLLVPTLGQSRSLGGYINLPVFWNIAPDKDLTITPTFYTGVRPGLGAEYRQHIGIGPFKVGGFATYVSRQETGLSTQDNEVRGYVYASGQFQHSSRWRSTFFSRLASDDTFLRRYDISDDDVLRNNYRLERFGNNDYLVIQGWAFQGLRQFDRAGLTPFALPDIDYQWRSGNDILGGIWSIRANALSLNRTEGIDTQRLSASTSWTRSALTNLGQKLTATIRVRGDLYYNSNTDRPDDAVYAGREGWQGRLLPQAALEASWPLAGPLLRGVQTLEPVVQLVAAPKGGNSGITNEDSRAFDLEDTNLFNLNRFAGYDRWEGGSRITYGARWGLSRGILSVTANVGQSYRVSNDSRIFPDGTGLSGHFSDIVGRTTVSIGSYVDFIHRYRVQKNRFVARRNEIDAVVGTKRTYLNVGYSRLNRNIAIEDLEDRQEIRAGGRVQITQYWSIMASTIIDLTSRADNPLALGDGFDPIRHRVGLQYEDECFSFSISWRKRFTEDRDFRRGTTVFVSFSLKNLGANR